MFVAFAYPPNELGYCGPPDPALLLRHDGSDRVTRARAFDGAWPYLVELAAAAGGAEPLRSDVVQAYWLGGELQSGVDGARLAQRLRCALQGQPTGLLDAVPDDRLLAHHSFQVFVVYPWVPILARRPAGAGPALKILQQCRIRWGVVDAVGDEHAVLTSQPLGFEAGQLLLGAPTPETVRWRGVDGTALAPRPAPGDMVAAHWDWICGSLGPEQHRALVQTTTSTLDLVNGLLRAGPRSPAALS
ncbi:hypothetical protein MDUV_46300 [Mycolicibacterium duvalii]|uniref:Uncharacterized protein n=2 Tax=Mycolicibacterium duvalii TaxID=39688 RepID=A0A7I7K6G6_9MYCO|nr:hypothetical protein MDUV_46300 [Mycolicibacterium duvalii]